ncbi:alpha/beta hydrolase [Streptomyces sp. ODS28]|uniref:alpha/beta hydrolase n=1 Tax=Streptomyces sp. ODS28 TaxID=3136688 RepID=UPI0031EC9DC8
MPVVTRRLRRALVASALVGVTVAGTAGWAAGTAQTPVTGPPPGSVSWRADDSLGRELPAPDAGPARIARFFDGLDAKQRQGLAHRHPLIVGNLDGAPVKVRYEANRTALRQAVRIHRERAADSSLPRSYRDTARGKADRYAELLAPGRQILAFDPRGRGQLAVVHGDLERARRTAVVVPGNDVDLASFDRKKDRYGTSEGMATALRARMARQSPGTRTAVIAWAGYTTPVGVGPDAATSRLAEAGAPRLERLLHGLDRTGAAAPTVFCHSYGSVLCAKAAPHLTRRDASGLVVLASPGMDVGSARDLSTSVPVWATQRDEGDWIGRVPSLRVFGVGHGADPADPDFGARLLASPDSRGHTGYFAPGSGALANYASLTLGSYERVRCAEAGCTDDV